MKRNMCVKINKLYVVVWWDQLNSRIWWKVNFELCSIIIIIITYSSTRKSPNCAISAYNEWYRWWMDGCTNPKCVGWNVSFLRCLSQLLANVSVSLLFRQSPTHRKKQMKKKTKKKGKETKQQRNHTLHFLESNLGNDLFVKITNITQYLKRHEHIYSNCDVRWISFGRRSNCATIYFITVLCAIHFVCPQMKQLIIAVMSSVFSVVLVLLCDFL